MTSLQPHSVAVLFHYTPPVDVGPEPALFLMMPDDSEPREVDLEELGKIRAPVVSHSLSLLVEWARVRKVGLPPMVVDLEGAIKMLIGTQRGAGWRLQAPSSLRTILSPILMQGADEESWDIYLEPGSRPTCDRSELARRVKRIAHSMRTTWNTTRRQLAEKGELSRFVDIEVPCYNLFLRAQYQGVRVDAKLQEHFIDEAEDEYEKNLHWLAISQRIDVDRALVDSEYLAAAASLPIKGDELERPAAAILERWSHISDICAGLRQVHRLRISRDILLRFLSTDSDRCWVTFDTLGTVTGRILSVDPHLQHLRKRYRRVLMPDAGKEFLYLDFAQYEPSILASVSGDTTLRKFILEGDVYEAIGRRLPGLAFGRDELKLLFLSYSYGMESGGLTTLIHSLRPHAAPLSAGSATKLQGLFPELEGWKRQVWFQLEKYGRIGTLNGNYRYRRDSGPLTDRERRWAVNQVIQGTGALILKHLCLSVDREVPAARIVLPVHDALLLEIPTSGDQQVLTTLQTLFREAFASYCRGVEVRVDARDFAE